MFIFYFIEEYRAIGYEGHMLRQKISEINILIIWLYDNINVM